MDFNEFFNEILKYYNITTITDLSKKINATRTTLSGWKSRKALGTMIEHINNFDPKIIAYIFYNKYHNTFEEERTEHYSKFNSIFINENQIPNKCIINSLRGELGEKKKNTRNWFQHQIILMYRAFEQKESDINSRFKREDLIIIIEKFDIEILSDTLQNGITAKDKKDTIKFINELDNIQINYIVNDIDQFLQILWENILITSENKPKFN